MADERRKDILVMVCVCTFTEILIHFTVAPVVTTGLDQMFYLVTVLVPLLMLMVSLRQYHKGKKVVV